MTAPPPPCVGRIVGTLLSEACVSLVVTLVSVRQVLRGHEKGVVGSAYCPEWVLAARSRCQLAEQHYSHCRTLSFEDM